MAQYKIEPTGPSAPATDWQPPEGYHTSHAEWTIDGLPPAAMVRVRVRAIGAEIGPWSDEVLGRAR